MKEKLMFQNAPHVRQSESVVTMMADVIISLLPIYLMSFSITVQEHLFSESAVQFFA
jgi:Na+-translocating ferredoxin:NAD+ oxidoreductase RnfD subunit